MWAGACRNPQPPSCVFEHAHAKFSLLAPIYKTKPIRHEQAGPGSSWALAHKDGLKIQDRAMSIHAGCKERESALRSCAVQGVGVRLLIHHSNYFAWRSHSPDSGVSNGTFRCRPRGSGCLRITQSTKRTCAPAAHACPRRLFIHGSRAQRRISVGAGRRRAARR